MFPWEQVAAVLDGGKDSQVAYLMVLSGSCLQSPLLQSTGKVYPGPNEYTQDNTEQRPCCPVHTVQHSMDLLRITAVNH